MSISKSWIGKAVQVALFFFVFLTLYPRSVLQEERHVVFFEELFPARFEYLDTSIPEDLGLSPQGGSVLVVQHCRDFGDLAPAPPTLVWNEGYWEKVGTEISTSWKVKEWLCLLFFTLKLCLFFPPLFALL